MDTNRDETARLTADVVLLAYRDDALHVLLIKRKHEPFRDQWALPGGHLEPGEDFWTAAHRELHEETGLTVSGLREVAAYSAPGRDPRGRYVTTAYVGMLPAIVPAMAADDATEAQWVPVNQGWSNTPLAFDHADIIADAVGIVGGHA